MTSGAAEAGSPLVIVLVAPLLGALGFLVLWYESPHHKRWRGWARAVVARLTGTADLAWLDLRLVVGTAVGAMALSAVFYWVVGGYDCSPAGPSDLITLLTAGRAFLDRGDPFSIAACGTIDNPVPAGMASVLIDAVGSLGGAPGEILVWEAVALGMLPLLWHLAGKDRLSISLFVLVSPLFLPVVVTLDGASLSLVPLGVLLTVYVAHQRGWIRGAALGGLLATGRFPALFPTVGATGRADRRGWVAGLTAIGAFAAVTLATVAVYGREFTGPVFFLQFQRVTALNYWGVLEAKGWLEPSNLVTSVQAGLTIVLIAVCWRWARTEIGAASVILTGTVLLAQFLSFNELVFLLPIALVGVRARWWLWSVGVVGWVTSAFSLLTGTAYQDAFYGLCFVLTGLLAGLMVELLRSELGSRPAAAQGGGLGLAPARSRSNAAERAEPSAGPTTLE